jgi:MoaA/NifB/PqqE/SkfB family radical SAM enzyme
MRARLAAMIARRAYRTPLVDDVPRSRAYYAVRYGTWAKLFNYLRVSRDFRLKRTRVASRPYIIRLEPISTCNLHCPLCPTGTGEVDRERAAMSEETLDAILERVGRHALRAVLWIWGEPFLNKNLDKLVAVCRRHNVGSEVSSHLSLPLSQERIDRIITSGLDWLIVSNDGASAATYERYRVGGDFDQVVRNMKAIMERKRALGSLTPFVEWQFVPLRHNEHEMAEVVRMAREIGVDGVRFKPARLDKTRNLTFHGTVPVDLTREWAPSDPALSRVITREKKSFHDFHCPFLWASVSVYADGAVAPCCETTTSRDDMGNLFAQDFMDLWNGPAYVKARRVALGAVDEPQDTLLACHGCKVFHKPLAPAHQAQA